MSFEVATVTIMDFQEPACCDDCHLRAAGSNLRMVRPRVVKLLIIRAQSALQNLDLGIFSSEEALSLHFSFKLGF